MSMKFHMLAGGSLEIFLKEWKCQFYKGHGQFLWFVLLLKGPFRDANVCGGGLSPSLKASNFAACDHPLMS